MIRLRSKTYGNVTYTVQTRTMRRYMRITYRDARREGFTRQQARHLLIAGVLIGTRTKTTLVTR